MVSPQLRALDTVLAHAQEEERRLLREKLDAMALDLERSRMAAEDARGQTFWWSGDRPVSWRDFAMQRNQLVADLSTEVISPALDLVAEAALLLDDERVDLAADAIQGARRVLAQYEEEDDEESEDSAAEESEASE